MDAVRISNETYSGVDTDDAGNEILSNTCTYSSDDDFFLVTWSDDSDSSLTKYSKTLLCKVYRLLHTK